MSPQHEPSTSQERTRNPRMLIVLFVILCGLFVAGYMERLSLLESARQEVAEMSMQVAASRQRQAELLEEQSRVQDPAYLALRARDDIGLAPEGELMVVIYDGAPRAVAPPVSASTPVHASTAQPIWRQWLDLIFPRP